jgi:hypothetical protein
MEAGELEETENGSEAGNLEWSLESGIEVGKNEREAVKMEKRPWKLKGRLVNGRDAGKMRVRLGNGRGLWNGKEARKMERETGQIEWRLGNWKRGWKMEGRLGIWNRGWENERYTGEIKREAVELEKAIQIEESVEMEERLGKWKWGWGMEEWLGKLKWRLGNGREAGENGREAGGSEEVGENERAAVNMRKNLGKWKEGWRK